MGPFWSEAESKISGNNVWDHLGPRVDHGVKTGVIALVTATVCIRIVRLFISTLFRMETVNWISAPQIFWSTNDGMQSLSHDIDCEIERERDIIAEGLVSWLSKEWIEGSSSLSNRSVLEFNKLWSTSFVSKVFWSFKTDQFDTSEA